MENKSNKKRHKTSKDKSNIETENRDDSQVFVKRDDSFTIPEANIAPVNSYGVTANLETDSKVNLNSQSELHGHGLSGATQGNHVTFTFPDFISQLYSIMFKQEQRGNYLTAYCTRKVRNLFIKLLQI